MVSLSVVFLNALATRLLLLISNRVCRSNGLVGPRLLLPVPCPLPTVPCIKVRLWARRLVALLFNDVGYGNVPWLEARLSGACYVLLIIVL